MLALSGFIFSIQHLYLSVEGQHGVFRSSFACEDMCKRGTVGSQPEAVTSFLNTWVGQGEYSDLWEVHCGCAQAPQLQAFAAVDSHPASISSSSLVSLLCPFNFPSKYPQNNFLPIPFSWSDFVNPI